MNLESQRQLDVHVPILGWVFIVGSGLILLIAGFIFALLFGIGIATGDPEAMPILSIVAILVAGFLFLVSIPGFVAGYGLLTRKSWGRILGLVVAVLNIANFPIGTILAVYAIWVLLPEDAGAYFQGEPQET